MALPASKRGSAPGEHRGGRTKEVPNKITLERAEQVINTARRRGHELAVHVMDTFMQHFAREAYRLMPEKLPDGTETNPDHDQEAFEKNAAIACRLAEKLAPFQSPTMRAIAVVAPPPPVNPEDLTKRFTLSIFEGNRQAAIATVQRKPTVSGNGHDAQVVAIQAEIEDEEK